MLSVTDSELSALVRDGNATIPQETEYAWRVTVASWRDNARTCEDTVKRDACPVACPSPSPAR